MLFSAPRDPAKRFFLTHYSIAIAPGAGPRAQWVSLESTAGGYRFALHLADTTPTALSKRKKCTQCELDHTSAPLSNLD